MADQLRDLAQRHRAAKRHQPAPAAEPPPPQRPLVTQGVRSAGPPRPQLSVDDAIRKARVLAGRSSVWHTVE